MPTLSETGFHFGAKEAPVKVIVFTNLACPHCATFLQDYDAELLPAIENKQLELILKPFDKPKVSLLKGNLVHLFLDYKNQATTNPIILQLFKDQPEWKPLTDNELKIYLTENYGLTAQPDNTDRSLTIIQEAINFDATSVPTALISRNGATPTKITQDELKKELKTTPVK